MSKIWKLKPENSDSNGNAFAAYPELLRYLLLNRGFLTENEAEEFLNPDYGKLHSPFLFKDMAKAVERIWQAINQNEKIYIYGDYDADAVTANSVLQQTFRFLGTQVFSYIPDRFTEGYGVNLDAVKKIKADGAGLIITVDCGTNSTDVALWCKENGVDFIITDHHEIIGEAPDAYALINPKNLKDTYPFSEITGVGVAFKLACGILSKEDSVALRLSVRADRSGQPATFVSGWEKWLLDLVAIGTVADCHSLLGENRLLVKYGLKVLQKTRWTGLKALAKSAGADMNAKVPDTYLLGFVIAPRLNAAGRLEHADVALDLLLESNGENADQKANNLELVNQRRQQLTATVVSEAKEQVLQIQERKILALVGEGWPKGVVGLVAGRLAEEYFKPVIVLEKTDLICTGSARTAGDFDIIEALKHASTHLLKFGGHKQAAGLSLQAENFEQFYQKLLEFAETNITPEKSQRILWLEAELKESDLSLETLQLVQKLEPFGVGNPHPKFLLSGAEIVSSRTVGAKSQHTQYQFKKGNKTIPGIAFNSAMLEKNFKVGDTVDIACELMEDGWNGRRQIKLKVIDLRKIEN